MLTSILMFGVAYIVFWYKGNAKDIYGLQWSPFHWWLYTSLVTNYLCLIAWWKLVEISDVWRAGVICGIIHICVEVSLNSYHYGFNPKGVIALALIALAGFIVYS